MTEPLPLWASRLAVFDTETTGVDPREARIVSAAIALLDADGQVEERYDWLLDPGIEIPREAAEVHGITTEVARVSGVEAAVGVAQISARLFEMFERGLPVVVYNAPYDLTLLRVEAERHGLPWPGVPAAVLDPLILDKQVDRYRKGKRTLEAVTEHYGVVLGSAHDAGADAVAAGRVAQAIARRFARVLPDELAALHTAQAEWAGAQAESFQDYMRRVRDPRFVADGTWPVR